MAPSTTSALHPIVIDPVNVPPHFTTLGTGLLYRTYPRESSAALKSLVSNPTEKTKPKAWWKAQCLLYGLPAPESATIGTMKGTLETALKKKNGLEVPEGMVELEHKENGKFRKLNASVREATGRTGPPGSTENGAGSEGAAVSTVASKGKAKANGKDAHAKKDVLKTPKDAKKVTKKSVDKGSTSTKAKAANDASIVAAAVAAAVKDILQNTSTAGKPAKAPRKNAAAGASTDKPKPAKKEVPTKATTAKKPAEKKKAVKKEGPVAGSSSSAVKKEKKPRVKKQKDDPEIIELSDGNMSDVPMWPVEMEIDHFGECPSQYSNTHYQDYHGW